MSEIDVIRTFQAAQVDPSPANLEALKPLLSDGVEFSGLGGRAASGVPDTLKVLEEPQVSRLLAQAEWEQPNADGDVGTVTARLGPGQPIGGATISFTFANGTIQAIAYEMLPAIPAPVTELALTERMREDIGTALMTGNPMLVAYVRPDGYPRLTYRGSTQVWSDTALAVWVRDPAGGLLSAIAENDHVTLWYRRADPITNYQFWGRARVQNDEETREKVYANAPEAEQRADAQKRGIPIIIELERIEGRAGRDAIRMERSAG